MPVLASPSPTVEGAIVTSPSSGPGSGIGSGVVPKEDEHPVERALIS